MAKDQSNEVIENLDESVQSAVKNAEELGIQIAEQLLAQGADRILSKVYSQGEKQ